MSIARPIHHSRRNQSVEIDPSEIVAAVNRICAHRLFVKSRKLTGFLKYTVKAGLDGRGPGLKEYTIATAVFGRDDGFDPCFSSIVRTQALILRRKLQMFYQETNEPLRIVYEPGSYAPAFQWSTAQDLKDRSELTNQKPASKRMKKSDADNN